jgi:signal peptidase I
VNPAPRKPWLAVLLALVCPGLGHVYLGRLRVAVVIALVYPTVMSSRILFGALVPPLFFASAMLGIAMSALFWLLQAGWAGFQARSAGLRYTMTPLNRVWVYLLFWALSYVPSSLIGLPLRAFVAEPFRMPSSSMAPGLIEGDQFFVLKLGPGAKWGIGDVVVYPVADGKTFIKRVAGLGGDSVYLDGQTLRVNDRVFPTTRCEPPELEVVEHWPGREPHTSRLSCFEETANPGRTYRVLYDSSDQGRRSEPVTVGKDDVFLLGDNRDNSEDSRFMPATRRSEIIGRAAVIWFSYSAEDGIRWSRMGTRL